jgi:hypothetical protein
LQRRFNAAREPAGALQFRIPQDGERRLCRFVSWADDAKNQRKRNRRFVKRNEPFRIPYRKSLKSLWAVNQVFRGIVCFQALSRHFVSPFSRNTVSTPSSRGETDCEAVSISSRRLRGFQLRRSLDDISVNVNIYVNFLLSHISHLPSAQAATLREDSEFAQQQLSIHDCIYL